MPPPPYMVLTTLHTTLKVIVVHPHPPPPHTHTPVHRRQQVAPSCTTATQALALDPQMSQHTVAAAPPRGMGSRRTPKQQARNHPRAVWTAVALCPALSSMRRERCWPQDRLDLLACAIRAHSNWKSKRLSPADRKTAKAKLKIHVGRLGLSESQVSAPLACNSPGCPCGCACVCTCGGGVG